MNLVEQMMALHGRKPFVPFRITLRDGRKMMLTDARRFAMNRFLMIIGQDSGPALRVRTEQVTSVEVLEPIA